MATYGGELSLERFLALSARGRPVRRRPRGRQRRPRPGRRAGDGADALPLPRALRVRAGRPRRRRCSLLLVALVAAARLAAGAGSRAGGAPTRRPGELGWLERAAERRRRLRGSRRDRLEPGDDRLGDARARGRRPQPARRRATGGKTPVDFLRSDVAELRTAATSPARSSRSRAPASTRAASAAATWSRELRNAPRPRRLLRGLAEPDRLRRPRAARRRRRRRLAQRRRPGCAARRTSDGGWGIQPRRAEQRRRHRRGDAGARRGGGRRPASGAARLPAQAPALRRRLRARRQRRVNSQSTAWAVQGMIAAGAAGAITIAAARLDYLAACRPPTATTATRRRATRRPIWVTAPGRCSRSQARPFPLAPCRARGNTNRGDDAGRAPARGEARAPAPRARRSRPDRPPSTGGGRRRSRAVGLRHGIGRRHPDAVAGHRRRRNASAPPAAVAATPARRGERRPPGRRSPARPRRRAEPGRRPGPG